MASAQLIRLLIMINVFLLFASRNHIHMYEQLTRSENKFQASAVRRTKVNDLSFKLMDENSPTCHQMFGGEEEEDSGSWW